MGVHDLAIINYLFGGNPVSVSAYGLDHINKEQNSKYVSDMAYITIQYSDIVATLNLKWLSPIKVRTTIIGGSEKSIIWDDTKMDRKLKIHDRVIVPTFEDQSGQSLGNMFCPRIEPKEALLEMCNHIYECVDTGKESIIDGEEGLKVVRMLNIIDKSLLLHGQKVEFIWI